MADLAHGCAIFLYYLDLGNIDRNPNSSDLDHLAGQLTTADPDNVDE